MKKKEESKEESEVFKKFEQLENMKKTKMKKGELSKKIHELYSWIADVKGRDCIYIFEINTGDAEYDVYYKDGKFIKSPWNPEVVNDPEEIGTFYITYSRLPKLLNVAIKKVKGYIKDSQREFASEYKLNRILNCIKKG